MSKHLCDELDCANNTKQRGAEEEEEEEEGQRISAGFL